MKSQRTRRMGSFALMMTGLGSIIGSGWLFGAAHAAKIAGPAAILAWILGALIILVIAMSYAELGSMFPESGGMVRFTRYSHGGLLGFMAAWGNWISIVSVIPIEAEASVQYMSSWPWVWAHQLYQGGELSPAGLVLAGLLVLVYFALNYWSVHLFAKTNTAITIFKMLVPMLTALALFGASFHSSNFTQASTGGFAPYGWASVFTAIATSGIVFSFNGFQSPLNLAGETRNPKRSIPLGVIGSILLAAVIYVLLQVAFIGALEPSQLIHGWHSLDFSSPFAQLAFALGLNVLMLLLYFDAFVSPSGTGATYMATTSRMIYAMQRNRTLPAFLGVIHGPSGIPRAAMWLNLLVAFIFMFFFRGWGVLAAVISVATVISYLTGPVCVAALRRIAQDVERPFRLPAMRLIAPLAFVLASLVLYWARWPLTGEIIVLMVIALPLYFYYQHKLGWLNMKQDFKGALWMIVYLPMMAVLSFLGSKEFGGIDVIKYGWDMLVVALLTLVFFHWGVRSGWRTPFLEERHAERQAFHAGSAGESAPVPGQVGAASQNTTGS